MFRPGWHRFRNIQAQEHTAPSITLEKRESSKNFLFSFILDFNKTYILYYFRTSLKNEKQYTILKTRNQNVT